MYAVLLAVSDETMRDAHGLANLIFLFLPIFLAVVAGLCLLVLAFRKDLDAGKAASLSALAGVIVVGLFHLESKRHDAAMHAAHPPPPGPAEASMAIQRSLEQVSAENGMLRERIHLLEARLEGDALPTLAPGMLKHPRAPLPAEGLTPPPMAPRAKGDATAPPIAIPPRPGGPPTPPDAGVSPEMPKESSPGPEKDPAPKSEAPKPSEGAGTPPAPVDGGAGEGTKAGEKP